jgi:hypothetical protein
MATGLLPCITVTVGLERSCSAGTTIGRLGHFPLYSIGAALF